MRIRLSSLLGRLAMALCLLVSFAASLSSQTSFVSAGFVITIKSASINSSGVIGVDYTIADSHGRPLDITGVTTAGTVSVSYLAAYIPNGQANGETYFWSYTTRSSTGATNNVTTLQAGSDSGGTLSTVALGEYIYTFKTKAVNQTGGAFDPTATTRIGLYGSRNLTEFDLGTNYASATYDFVPNGSKVSVTRDIVRNGACNKCHDNMAFHGGSRQGFNLCIMCHQNQTVDPNTGNNLAADIFFHKLHMGSSLPSVQAGGHYQIVGFNNTVADFSTVVFPANGGPLACTACHDPAQNAAQQNKYLTNPNREACGACHDNVNFATGANHVNLPEISDQQCAGCHITQGELPFDASIVGAHTIATQYSGAPGINLAITGVANGVAGKAPAGHLYH